MLFLLLLSLTVAQDCTDVNGAAAPDMCGSLQDAPQFSCSHSYDVSDDDDYYCHIPCGPDHDNYDCSDLSFSGSTSYICGDDFECEYDVNEGTLEESLAQMSGSGSRSATCHCGNVEIGSRVKYTGTCSALPQDINGIVVCSLYYYGTQWSLVAWEGYSQSCATTYCSSGCGSVGDACANGNCKYVPCSKLEVQEVVCGDGYVEGSEECDGGSDCTADCTYEITYGGGDPHFVGFSGEDFDFYGVPGAVFNILTSENIQINAHFASMLNLLDNKPRTLMDEIGVLVSNQRILLLANGTLLINGATMNEGSTLSLNNGVSLMWSSEHVNIGEKLSADLFQRWYGSVPHVSSHRLTITFEEFRFEAFIVSTDRMPGLQFIDIVVAKLGAMTGAYHGILGQTAMGTAEERGHLVPVTGYDTDYMVWDGIFGSKFKFNLFGLSP